MVQQLTYYLILFQHFKTLTTQLSTDYTVETEFLSDEIDLMIDLIEENAGVFDSESGQLLHLSYKRFSLHRPVARCL